MKPRPSWVDWAYPRRPNELSRNTVDITGAVLFALLIVVLLFNEKFKGDS
jgi:hypothetical protein